MKLRNKKTGEIIEFACVHICNYHTNDKECEEKDVECRSLEKLLENWEDYKPAEPLIKDPKIRKAVRAWAEANGLDGASYYTSSHHWYLRAFNDREQGIDFWLKWNGEPNLIKDKYYTIAELCGEEEE